MVKEGIQGPIIVGMTQLTDPDFLLPFIPWIFGGIMGISFVFALMYHLILRKNLWRSQFQKFEDKTTPSR